MALRTMSAVPVPTDWCKFSINTLRPFFHSVNKYQKHYSVNTFMSSSGTKSVVTAKWPRIERYRVFVALDLEGASNEVINGIGLAVRDSNGRLLLKRRWWIKTDEERFCPDTLRTFWKNEEKCPKIVWEDYLEHGEPAMVAIASFVGVWDHLPDLLSMIPKNQERITWDHIRLLSDNPEYDYGRLTAYIKEFGGIYFERTEPLRYLCEKKTYVNEAGELCQSMDGKYRSITDIGDALWIGSASIGKMVTAMIDPIVKHTHMPDDDADHIIINHMVHETILFNINRLFDENQSVPHTMYREIAEQEVDRIQRAI